MPHTKSNWVEIVDRLTNAGEFSRAADFIINALNTSSADEQNEALTSRLILVLIQQSRYREAYSYTAGYELALKAPHIPHLLTIGLGYAFCISHYLGWNRFCSTLAAIVRSIYSFKEPSPLDWRRSQALLWGVYWQNINSALKYNLCSCAHANGDDERLRSIGFLAYTLAFKGHSTIGLTTMKVVLDQARRNLKTDLLNDMYVFFGVALQMSSKAKECFRTHELFAAELPTASAFSRIISHASRLNVAFSEMSPGDAEKEADACFKAAFALQESRNHIQIYGVKAALLAIECRTFESEIYLDKARQAAARNDNPLDHLIFSRFEAATFLNLGRHEDCAEALKRGRELLAVYGAPIWYKHELDRVDYLLKLTSARNLHKKAILSLSFIAKTTKYFNFDRLQKTCRIVRQAFFDRRPSYWPATERLEYLTRRIANHRDGMFNGSSLERLTLSVTDALLKNSFLNANNEPKFDDLLEVIREAFPEAKLIYSNTLAGCMNHLRSLTEILPSTIFNEHDDLLRVPCRDDQFFIAVSSKPNPESPEIFAIGLLLADLNVGSQNVVEAGLRVFIATYITLKSIWISRREHANNEQKIAIANMSAQVAHDIRSPLGALNMITASLESLSDEKRILIRSAINRIKDIANDLLGKNLPSTTKMQKGTSDLYLVSALLDSLITEKRLQYRGLLDVAIDIISDESSYGLFSSCDPIGLKRSISNLVNNAVESLDGTGRVDIHLFGENERIILAVKDNGKGIPEGILPKLMSRGVTYGKPGGSGLGLSHARAFAEISRGRLSISSTLGVGTEVRLELPRSPAPKWFIPEIRVSRETTVVVLDDDSSIHGSWKERFDSIRTLHFSSAEEFRQWFRNSTDSDAHLFLFDYELSGQTTNGLDLIEELSLQARSILVTSRYEEVAILDRCDKLAVGLLAKGMVGYVPVRLSSVEAL